MSDTPTEPERAADRHLRTARELAADPETTLPRRPRNRTEDRTNDMTRPMSDNERAFYDWLDSFSLAVTFAFVIGALLFMAVVGPTTVAENIVEFLHGEEAVEERIAEREADR